MQVPDVKQGTKATAGYRQLGLVVEVCLLWYAFTSYTQKYSQHVLSLCSTLCAVVQHPFPGTRQGNLQEESKADGCHTRA